MRISKVIIEKEELPKEAIIIHKKEAKKEIKPKRMIGGIARRIFRRKAIG